MASPKISKQRKVINFMAKGRTISAAQARHMYGVKNLRATISDIRTIVQEYGNWQIINEDGRYSMRDTHPGNRVFSFDRNGRRSIIA